MKMIAVYINNEKEPIAILKSEVEARKWLYRYVDENVATGFGISTNIVEVDVNVTEVSNG